MDGRETLWRGVDPRRHGQRGDTASDRNNSQEKRSPHGRAGVGVPTMHTGSNNTMQRKTLDLIFATGGVVIAVLLGVIGLVLNDQADFARSYVKEQLGEQQITFTAADKLTDEEKTWKDGSSCLTKYAGQLMDSGKQAECYANYYINLHLENGVNKAGYVGATYATLGSVQSTLRTEIADLKTKNDANGAAEAQKKLDSVSTLRETQFKGETLRGLLLTSYGFSIFGEKAALAATLCYSVAGLLGALSVAGYVHALLAARRPA